MSNGTPPPPPGAPPAKKKGLSTIAWVAIGCGGILVLALLAFGALGFFAVKKGSEMVQEATGSSSVKEFVRGLEENPARTAAETAIRLNPELELLETDDEAGTITFQNSRTGETATVNFADIAEGRLDISTDEGDYSLDASNGVTVSGPDGETKFGVGAAAGELPTWVPLYPEGSGWSTVYSTVTDSSSSGTTSGQTADTPEDVVAYYLGWFGENGYDVGSQTLTKSNQGVFGTIAGKNASTGRNLTVALSGQEGEIQILLNYSASTE